MPTSGQIRLKNRLIEGASPYRIARLGVARTFQLVRVLPTMTVSDNVLAALAHGARPLWGAPADEIGQSLLARVGLGDKGAMLADQLT